MCVLEGSTRLKRHRMTLQQCIQKYLATDLDRRPAVLVRICALQGQFNSFRKTAKDWTDPLAWVDSWRPPRDEHRPA